MDPVDAASGQIGVQTVVVLVRKCRDNPQFCQSQARVWRFQRREEEVAGTVGCCCMTDDSTLPGAPKILQKRKPELC